MEEKKKILELAVRLHSEVSSHCFVPVPNSLAAMFPALQ